MLRSYSVAPSRSGRSARLWTAASLLALAAASVAPQAASAADFTASDEAQLQAALNAAGASGIAQPTIGLTGSFALTGPVTLPNKVIFLDPAGFTLTGLTFNGASTLAVSGAGIVPLVGNSSAGAFSVRTGEVRLEGGATVTAASEANVFSGGTLVVDGAGSLLTAGKLSFANGGAATVEVRNGGVVHATSTSTNSALAVNSATNLLVTGAGSRLDIDGSAGFATTGSASRSWTIADGASSTIGGGLTIGAAASPQAIAPQVTVTGADSTLTTGSLVLGRGDLSVLAGANVTTGTLTVGPRIQTPMANLLISGAASRMVATGNVVVGPALGGVGATGAVTLANDGVLEARGAFTLGVASNGVLNIGGAEGSAAAAAGVLDTALATFGPGVGRINFNHTDTNYTFAPALTGLGAINQVAGVTRLTGNSAGFTGVTTISGGELHVENALGGATNNSVFTVGNGKLFVTNGGTVQTSGQVNFNGDVLISGAGSSFTGGLLRGGKVGVTDIRVENGGQLRLTTVATHNLSQTAGGTVNLTVTGAGSQFNMASTLALSSTTTSDANLRVENGATANINRINFASPSTGGAITATVTGVGTTVNTLSTLGLYSGRLEILDRGHMTATLLAMGGNSRTGNMLVSGAGSRLDISGAMTVAGIANGGGVITLADSGVLAGTGLTLGGATGTTSVLSIGGAEGASAAAAGVLDTPTVTFGQGTNRLNFNHTDTNYSFSAAMSGGNGTINHAAGVTHLTADSSGFTGATNILGGTLQVDGQLGGAINVASGGRLGGAGTLNGSVVVANGGVVAPGNSPGTLTIAGNLTLNPTSRLDMEFGQQGVVGGPMNDLIKVGGDLALDGVVDVTVTSGGAFDAGLYRVLTYGGALSGPGLTLGSVPAGATVTVQTAIPGQINLINTAGLPLNFWDGANTTPNASIDGGAGVWDAAASNWTLQTGTVNSAYTPSGFAIFAGTGGAVTTDTSLGALRIGGAQFAVDGVSLAGDAVELDAGSVNIRVGDGTSDGEAFVATIDAALTGAGRLVKTDRGTLTLNADNSYAGGTQVSNGTLVINGVQAGGAANLVGLAGTLRGAGALGGDLTVDGALAPGGLAGPGTLTLNGDLTLNSTARLNYRLGQADVIGGALNDLLTVNGDLTLDGTLNVTQSAGGTFGPGLYRLIDYTGSLVDNGLNLGVLPGAFSSVVQTSIAGQINLVTDVAPPAAPPTYSFWDGDTGVANDGQITGGSGVWRRGVANWTTADGAQNGGYATNLVAIFAGAAGGVTVDGSAGAVSVQSLQFAANGYRLSGDAITLEAGNGVIRVGNGTTAGAGFDATIASALIGPGGLHKTDAGTLILTGANSYTGGTLVSGGALRIGDGGTTGSITGDVVNDAFLAFSRSDDVTFAGAITGGGTVAQIGGGTLTLTGNSTGFTGATEIRNGTLAVDGSLGGVVTVMSGARLLGAGQVGGIVNQTGGVVAPGRDGVVGTLTVAGNYAGAGGVLRMDATLAGDNAPADRLVVRGATSGVTPIQINRLAGSTGAPTPNGILLVQVDGASAPGAFVLASGDYQRNGEAVMVAGAYGYVLRRDAADGDWRLRSESVASGAGGGSAKPLFQPGVPVYEAYPQALQLLNGVGSLRERIGSRQWSDAPGSGVWGRFEGGHTKLQQAVSTTGADLSADRWKLQFGVDPLARDLDGGATLVGGLTAYYGEVRTRVTSPSGDGDIQTKGYGLGGALTWQGAGGGYIDAQVQAGRFDSDLSSRLAGRRTEGSDGTGYAASLEAGRAFTKTSLRLTPQAQLSYATVDFDSFADSFGAVVSNDESKSLIGRAGIAVDRDWSAGNLYAVANVSHEFLDGTRVDVSGIAVASRRERTWVGLATGGTYVWGGGRYVVYGEAAADTSAKGFGDSYQLTGTAGFRMRF